MKKGKLEKLLLPRLTILDMDEDWVEVAFSATEKREFNVDSDVSPQRLARRINRVYETWKRQR